MQIIHLLLADLVWIVLVLLTATTFASEQAQQTVPLTQAMSKAIRQAAP
jgi:hypothetical protein